MPQILHITPPYQLILKESMKSLILTVAFSCLLVDVAVAKTTENLSSNKISVYPSNSAIVAGLFDELRQTINDVNGTVKDARGTIEDTKDTKDEVNNLEGDVTGQNANAAENSDERKVNSSSKFYDTPENAGERGSSKRSPHRLEEASDRETSNNKPKQKKSDFDVIESLIK